MKALFFSMIVSGVLYCSCAPVFSDMQSAKLAGKGNFEATPGFTTNSLTEEGETEHIQDHFGFQVGYGLSNRFDLRARYEHVRVADDGGNTNVFGIGPKLSLLTDRIAAYIPVGFAFGGDVDGIEELEVQPTLLFTVPVGKYIEINPSLKGIIGDDFYGVFNLGLGISSNLGKYAIRPEYGLLFNTGENGHYSQFSIGATIYFSK